MPRLDLTFSARAAGFPLVKKTATYAGPGGAASTSQGHPPKSIASQVLVPGRPRTAGHQGMDLSRLGRDSWSGRGRYFPASCSGRSR